MKTDDAHSDQSATAETQAFRADVAKLLHLMVHSVYSDRDIFLRELISNAADACEKLRYEALDNAELIADGAPFLVTVTLDKEAGILSVADNGVGMDKRDLVEALGTIASSGTKAFLERMNRQSQPEGEQEGGKGGSAAELIGQFGIGFYSAFMAADRVDVETRRAGEDHAWLWTSDGKGSFAIAPLAAERAPPRGTRVILHLNETSRDFLEKSKVESVIREHSGAVAVPIELRETSSAEPSRVTDGAAVWAKPRNSVTAEEYAEFYRGLAGQFDEPALTVHWRAEGRHEYTVLAFIPGSRPLDLFDPERRGRAKLYVRRVLITRDCNVLPGWMRFVRLVVDSADLPLNVSREMIQESAVFGAIRRGVVNRLLQEMVKTSETNPQAWDKIWDNFGAVLKEGLYEAPEHRDQLFKIARFVTSKHPDGRRSLADYVADLRPNQTAIYYHLGDDAKRLAASPQLEGYRARGIEVLLLPDAIDAFWTSTSIGYEAKPFKSVTRGSADIKAVPLLEGEVETDVQPTPRTATLLAFMKQTLESTVSDVRPSDRLAASAACLVASEKGPDRRLERMLAEHGQLGACLSKPVLEVNPAHPLIEALAHRFEEGGSRDFIEDAAWLIHDEAQLMEGEALSDPAAFAARLARVLQRAAG